MAQVIEVLQRTGWSFQPQEKHLTLDVESYRFTYVKWENGPFVESTDAFIQHSIGLGAKNVFSWFQLLFLPHKNFLKLR